MVSQHQASISVDGESPIGRRSLRKQFWEENSSLKKAPLAAQSGGQLNGAKQRNVADMHQEQKPWTTAQEAGRDGSFDYKPFKAIDKSRESDVRGSSPPPPNSFAYHTTLPDGEFYEQQQQHQRGRTPSAANTMQSSYSVGGRKYSESGSIMYQSIIGAQQHQQAQHLMPLDAAQMQMQQQQQQPMPMQLQPRIVIAGGPEDPYHQHLHSHARSLTRPSNETIARYHSFTTLPRNELPPSMRYHASSGNIHSAIDPIYGPSGGHRQQMNHQRSEVRSSAVAQDEGWHNDRALSDDYGRSLPNVTGRNQPMINGSIGNGSREGSMMHPKQQQGSIASMPSKSSNGGSDGRQTIGWMPCDWRTTMRLALLIAIHGVAIMAAGIGRVVLKSRTGFAIESVHGAFTLIAGIIGITAADKRNCSLLAAFYNMSTIASIFAIVPFVCGLVFTAPSLFDNIPNYWVTYAGEPVWLNVAMSVLCVTQSLCCIAVSITGCKCAGGLMEANIGVVNAATSSSPHQRHSTTVAGGGSTKMHRINGTMMHNNRIAPTLAAADSKHLMQDF